MSVGVFFYLESHSMGDGARVDGGKGKAASNPERKRKAIKKKNLNHKTPWRKELFLGGKIYKFGERKDERESARGEGGTHKQKVRENRPSILTCLERCLWECRGAGGT